MNMKLLFLQLPRLDPDITSPGENLMSAAACLQNALERSPEAPRWDVLETPACQEDAADEVLVNNILGLQPDAVAATCYLWNIERTLHVLRRLKKRIPQIKIAIGGPDIAFDHPLLALKPHPADVFVIGEGETVFPSVMCFLRTGESPDFRGVAWRTPDGAFTQGSCERMSRPLRELLPPPEHPINRPDAFGMAYLETSRGCPLHCAFCCYNIRRTTISCLPPEEVAARLRILRARGAKEIRLTDPTFNAHPRFNEILNVLISENRDHSIAFFVEIRADTLTDEQAKRLAKAGVTEAEVGIQSTDPTVLKLIHRPLRAEPLLNGIEALLRHGIKPTLDFMYALPAQGRDDIQRSLDWLVRFGDRIHPQFLPTLLLPGTELRDRAAELGLRAQRLPPYRVLSTDRLSVRQLGEVEAWANERLGGFDSPTRRFVGIRLPDLFSSRLKLSLPTSDPAREADAVRGEISPPRVVAVSNRQAVLVSGPNLFAHRVEIAALIRQCVRTEPHILWQFVLEPADEEPLDLLDFLIGVFKKLPGHWLDRLVSPPGQKQRCARRLFIKLPRGKSIGSSWIAEAEALLSQHFH